MSPDGDSRVKTMMVALLLTGLYYMYNILQLFTQWVTEGLSHGFAG